MGRAIAVVLVVLMVLSPIAASVSVGAMQTDTAVNSTTTTAPLCTDIEYAGGGTASDPYEIANVSQLQCIREYNMSAHYVLVSDINASGTGNWNNGSGFNPIGALLNGTPSSITADTTSGIGSLKSPGVDRAGHERTTGAPNNNTPASEERAAAPNASAERNVSGQQAQSKAPRGPGNKVNASEKAIRNNPQGADLLLSNSDDPTPFRGTFDGAGHTITGLTIDRPNESYVALFGGVGENGVIKNVTLVNATTDGYWNVGSLVGSVRNGTVRNASATSRVNGTRRVGGLIGNIHNHTSVRDLSATSNVTGHQDVGGLLGRSMGTVIDGHSSGTVTGSGWAAGGLIGFANGTIRSSSATSTVTGSAGAGGLVGGGVGTITRSYATGDVNGTLWITGGLVGAWSQNGTIKNSYATGDVTGSGPTGALVGKSSGTVIHSYATGNVSTYHRDIGGLIGNTTENGSVRESYWDVNTTNQSTSDGGTGLTTVEMTGEAARDNMVGFDFNGTWNVRANDYPGLVWQERSETTPISMTGSGTADDPYIITNVSELQAMERDLDAHYRLGDDINATETATWNDGKGFDPVGPGATDDTRFNGTLRGSFNGSFDGAGHTIIGLTINRPNDSYVGLFGSVGPSASITNVTLTDANITGKWYVGSLVGLLARGTVRDVSTTSTVNGGKRVGGLIGDVRNDTSVRDLSATSNVTGVQDVGGLLGRLTWGANLTNGHSSGTVSASNWGAGGAVGFSMGTVRNSSSTSTVTGYTGIGGLVGAGPGDIVRSYATGDVNGTLWITGGLTGALFENGTVKNSYATGDVDEGGPTGALVGISYGTVVHSYATGTITTHGGTHVGGLIGNTTESGTVRESYWDVNTTNQTTSDGGTGLTTAEMTGDAARENMVGFDFNGTWNVRANDYPGLVWQERSETAPVSLPGSGTPDDPYIITNFSELQAMERDLDAHYVLQSHVDGDGQGFRPIGENKSVPFEGTLDGNGYAIRDVISKRPTEDYVGLFGAIGPSGVVKNITLRDVNTSGNMSVGGLAGTVNGTIHNVEWAGGVNGTYRVGGLVGNLGEQGIIESATATGRVNGSRDVGGVVGRAYGSAYDSKSWVTVTGSNVNIGGFAGFIGPPGFVSESFARENVTGPVGVGGFAGGVKGTVVESYAAGATKTSLYIGGGFAGYGSASSTINESYATGAVRGGGTLGGFIGYATGGTISESYAIGEINSTRTAGGFVGNNSNATITAAYWNTETTGYDYSYGGTGLTTAEMTGDGARDNMTGFDFGGTWHVQAGEYPKLVWQTEADDGGNGSSSSAELGFDPANATVSPNGTVTMNVTVDTNGASLYGATTALSYNTTLLNATDIEPGGFLSSDGSDTFSVQNGTIDDRNGTVEIAVTRQGADDGVTGMGTLATVTFESAAFVDTGETATVAIADETTLSDPQAEPIDYTTETGSISFRDANVSVSGSLVDPVWNVNSTAPVQATALATDPIESVSYSWRSTGGEVSNADWDETVTTTFTITPTESTWTGDGYAAENLTVSTRAGTGEDTDTLSVQVHIAGDATGDGTVNLFDAVAVGTAWDKEATAPGYNPGADLNSDGAVNISDGALLGQHWGTEASA